MTGEIEKTEDGVLVVRRVRVRYRLVVDELSDEVREKVDRVMGFHARRCPVARTIEGCVDISTGMEIVEAAG